MFALDLDDVLLAQLGQRAENHFVGAPVGVMDQMAASLADDHTALFLDTRTFHYETGRAASRRGARRDQFRRGAQPRVGRLPHAARRMRARRRLLGVPQLRDLAITDLDRIAALPDPLNRRARHVVTENQRVLDAVDAMKHGDLERLGQTVLRITRVPA